MKFLGLALVPALVAAVPARGVVNPGDVTIRNVEYGGTGCPQNTVGVAISQDRKLMTLIFDQYVSAIGPQAQTSENRKNCQINIELNYPPGFQYSVFSADYRGYAQLDANVTATLKSTYHFTADQSSTSSQVSWTGPYADDYKKHDTAPSTSIVWSPCGQDNLLNINSQIRLTSTNPKASGLLTTDSIDAKFTQVVYINWQTCKA